MTQTPSREDPFVAALSPAVGGPLGSRAGRHPWWTPVRVVLALTAIAFAAGMLQKSTCFATDWRDGELRYAHMCYSDIPYLHTGRGLADRHWPYTDDEQIRAEFRVMEYPVGISYAAWTAAWITHALPGELDQVGETRKYVAVTAVLLGAVTLLAAWLLAGASPGRPWDAAAFAVAPVLVLNGLINWDLYAVVLVAAALWAWSRDRPVLTGILIGLGAATKLYPLFLLGGVLVICLRRSPVEHGEGSVVERGEGSVVERGEGSVVERGEGSVVEHGEGSVVEHGEGSVVEQRASASEGAPVETDSAGTNPGLGTFLLVTAAALAAWLVANAPAYLTGPGAWREFWSFNSERAADLGSLWLVVQQAVPADDFAFEAGTINLWSWILFASWCLGVLVLGLAARRTASLAQLGFLIVAGFLLVNKVYSPQYVLWLLPLAVLAVPRWRELLIWQAGEILYFASVWWYLGGFLAPGGGGDAGFYWVAIVLRVAAQLFLVGVVVRDLWRPEDASAVELSRKDDSVERRAPVI